MTPRAPRGLTLALARQLAGLTPLPAQALSNLKALSHPVPVGDPLTVASDGAEGPKEIATADVNRDGKPDLAAGNLDGTARIGAWLRSRPQGTGIECCFELPATAPRILYRPGSSP